jgi:branched-subunit amino acid transport protein AzlD
MLIYILRWWPSWISNRHEKNTDFVEDLPMIIPEQSGLFYVFYADRKSKMAATAIHRLTLDPMGKFVEDHPMNIHVQFGFKNICSF